jgi:hypothetical protein
MSKILIIKLIAVLVGILSAGGGILYLKKRLKKGDKSITENKTMKRQKNSTVEIQRKGTDVKKKKINAMIKLTMLLLISSVILTGMGCKTCPTEVDPEVQEYLNVINPPPFPVFDPDNPELKEILIALNNEYTWNLGLLDSAKDTGDFYPEFIDEAIRIYQGRIDWIDERLESLGE